MFFVDGEVFLFYKIIKRRRKNKEERISTLRLLIDIQSEKEFDTSTEGYEILADLKAVLKRTMIDKELTSFVKEKTNELKEKIKELKQEEDIKELERVRQEEIVEEVREQKKKLLSYFKKKQSNISVPKWAIYFEKSVIENAASQYQNIIYEKERTEQQWKEITTFVTENEDYPINYQELSYEEQKLYEKAIKLKKQGKLTTLEKTEETTNITAEDKELLERKYYQVNELNIKERDKLIGKYNYKFKPFIHLDGSTGNNLIIKNNNPSESDYHFCIKNLIATIDESNSHIEYQKGNLRADIAFIYYGLKLAVEIETGTNKEKQIQEKVDWLNKNFNQWIIITKRNQKKKYKQYTNNKKSYCMTLKQASEKIEEIIHQINYYT